MAAGRRRRRLREHRANGRRCHPDDRRQFRVLHRLPLFRRRLTRLVRMGDGRHRPAEQRHPQLLLPYAHGRGRWRTGHDGTGEDRRQDQSQFRIPRIWRCLGQIPVRRAVRFAGSGYRDRGFPGDREGCRRRHLAHRGRGQPPSRPHPLPWRHALTQQRDIRGCAACPARGGDVDPKGRWRCGHRAEEDVPGGELHGPSRRRRAH